MKVNSTVFWASMNNPCYVCVPDYYFGLKSKCRFDAKDIDYSAFEKEAYAKSLWPEINARANRCVAGVRLYPDLHRHLSNAEAETRVFRAFVKRLEKAFYKA